MGQAMTKLFRRIGDYFVSSRCEDYERAVARVAAAIDSGKLRRTDKANLATPIIDAGQPGWLSPLDGIDWVELHTLAEENKMPLETVNDLLALFRFVIGKR